MAEQKGLFKKIETLIFNEQTLNDEEKQFLRKKVDDYWEDHPDVTVRYPKWRKHIAWVAGYQIYDYNKITQRLIEVPIKREKRIIFNKLRPFVRQLLAKLAADVPQMSVIPNTDEYEDIEAARVGSKVIEFLADKNRFIATLDECKLWLIICNRAFLRVLWSLDDSGLQGYRKVTEEYDQKTGELLNENEIGTLQPIPAEGDVVVESVSPFNCRVDPLYFDRRKWRWFIYGEEVDAEDIEIQYKLPIGSLTTAKDDVLARAYDLALQDEADVIAGSIEQKSEIAGRTTVFKEFWTPKIFVFVAGNKVVDYGKNEYREIPFFSMEDRLIPISHYEKGFTYNEGIIKDAIPVQREYNRQISLFSLALERASKLKILTPLGSLLSKKQWTNDYGVFIDYNPKAGQPPFQAKMDDLPPFLPTFKNDVEREFETVFSVHESSFGRLPERASHASGTLVNLLVEQDDVVLNPVLNMVNDACQGAWSLALKMVQNGYLEERLIRYVGDDKSYAIAKFKGADLRGNTDVKVVSQTGLPKSRALRIEYVMRMREAGLLKDDQATMEMLELGQAEKIFKDGLLNEQRAYRENAKIEENPNINPQEVLSWIHPLEDKATHIKIGLRLRFSPKFDKLLPNQQQALDALLMTRYQEIMQQQMAQAQPTEQPQTQEAAPEAPAEGAM